MHIKNKTLQLSAQSGGFDSAAVNLQANCTAKKSRIKNELRDPLSCHDYFRLSITLNTPTRDRSSSALT